MIFLLYILSNLSTSCVNKLLLYYQKSGLMRLIKSNPQHINRMSGSMECNGAYFIWTNLGFVIWHA